MLLRVPAKYAEGIDETQVRGVFPYGDIKVDVEAGGLLADSGIALEAMGDQNRDSTYTRSLDLWITVSLAFYASTLLTQRQPIHPNLRSDHRRRVRHCGIRRRRG